MVTVDFYYTTWKILTDALIDKYTGFSFMQKMNHHRDPLFGNAPFHRLAELETEHADDGVGFYESSDSQFETEPLDSSSSDDSEHVSPSRYFLSSHSQNINYRHRRHTSSVSEESSLSDGNVSEVPNWFIEGPFKYNGRVAVLALPGLILVLLFSGETFLCFSTLGCLIVCLLYSSGHKSRAMFAYVIVFIIIQLTVVYSVTPLIWKSFLNVFIIFALNTYSFLTGGWILLQFDKFKFRDPELLTMLETSLFTIYPASFTIQVTWLFAAMTTVAVAPYVFMLIGFIVLQIFTSPAQSSFVKPHAQGNLAVWDSEGYVLSPVVVATVAVMYLTSGPLLLLILRAAGGWATLISLSTVVQFLFVSSSSLFMASFFHLRMFIEKSGLSCKFLLILRWSSLIVSLVLISPLLHCFDIVSNLLPWIPAAATVLICLILALLGKTKSGVDVSMAVLSLIIAGMFYQLPWHLKHIVASNAVSLSFIQTVLLLNAVVCLVTFYGATYWSPDALGIALLIQSTCFIILSRLLLAEGQMWRGLILLMAMLYFYVSLRLFHSGRLPHQSSLILNSLQISSTVLTEQMYGSTLEYYGSSGLVVYCMSTFALVYVSLQLLIYEDSQITDKSVLMKYVFVHLIVLIVNIPLLFTDILQFFVSDDDLAVSTYLGFIGVVTCVIFGKLFCFNGCSAVKHKLSLLALIAVPSVALLILHPDFSLKRDDLQKWAFLISLSSTVSIVPLATLCGSYMHITGAAVGLPLGIGLLHTLFPSLPSLTVQITFGMLAVLCISLLLTACHMPRQANRWLRTIALWIGVCCLCLIALETVMPLLHQDSPLPQITLVFSAISCLFVSIVLRLHINLNQQETIGNLDQSHSAVDHLPLIVNIYTLVSFCLFIVCCFVQFESLRYLWICAGTPMFLLLTKDTLVFPTLGYCNRLAPTLSAVIVTIYAAAVFDCGLFNSTRVLNQVIGFFELTTLIASLPVASSLLTVLWRGVSCVPAVVVAFTAPAYLVLFLFGTDYSSWVLATSGIASAYWLMKYKLQSEDDG